MFQINHVTSMSWHMSHMVMGYWSVAILFWQLSIDHIVNVLYKRCGLVKTSLRHPSLPFDSLPYPTRTIRRRIRTLGQSRDNKTTRGWPYSMSLGLSPTRASHSWEPRYNTFVLCVTKNLHIWRILHGGEKIWILCSSGKNNISRVSAANEWDIVLSTRT